MGCRFLVFCCVFFKFVRLDVCCSDKIVVAKACGEGPGSVAVTNPIPADLSPCSPWRSPLTCTHPAIRLCSSAVTVSTIAHEWRSDGPWGRGKGGGTPSALTACTWDTCMPQGSTLQGHAGTVCRDAQKGCMERSCRLLQKPGTHVHRGGRGQLWSLHSSGLPPGPEGASILPSRTQGQGFTLGHSCR